MSPPLASIPHQLHNGSERESIEQLLAYLGTQLPSRTGPAHS
jgi:hypothetical protein